MQRTTLPDWRNTFISLRDPKELSVAVYAVKIQALALQQPQPWMPLFLYTYANTIAFASMQMP